MAAAPAIFGVIFAVVLAYWYTREPVPQVTKQLNTTYDYIIVGAGSSGSVVASRLSEDASVSVLVLEAGDTPEDESRISTPSAAWLAENTELDWTYRTEPQKFSQLAMNERRSAWPRGKVLGGSSCLNIMVAVRCNRNDYDNWAKEGCDGWSYKDVLPYFIKSEDIQIEGLKDSPYRGKGGPLVVSHPAVTPLEEVYVKAGVEMGYSNVDCNGKDQIGFCNMQSTIKNGERWSTYRAFLRPAMSRKNLHVAVNSHVSKVLIEKKRAAGVEVVRGSSKQEIYARKEVIVSGGAVNSPQILMLSGIGPKKHLEEMKIKVVSDLPVGEKLQDHLFVPYAFFINSSMSMTGTKLHSWSSHLQYSLFKSGPLAGPLLEGLGFVYDDDSKKDNGKPADLEFHFHSLHGYHNSMKDYFYKSFNYRHDINDMLYTDKITPEAFIVYTKLLHPKSMGVIKLKSTDPLDYPSIDPRYLEDKEDFRILRNSINKVKAMANTHAMRSIGVEFNDKSPFFNACKEHKFDTEPFWECYIRHFALTVYHPTSTCRMGAKSDPTAVVDPQLRVKGVSGLRVVDASVMRDVPSGNTNLPSIMIGEKAADMIRGMDSVVDIRKRLPKDI